MPYCLITEIEGKGQRNPLNADEWIDDDYLLVADIIRYGQSLFNERTLVL